jgi:hypothetical protein
MLEGAKSIGYIMFSLDMKDRAIYIIDPMPMLD